MSQIKVVPLGAGQDVGRSCIVVSIGGKNIMFDCGMHMGYNDERRFPNFKYLSPEGNFDQVIDCVIISHFHLDHCGALPYFTEMCGYSGPIVMTYPTKSVCPILLEDFRKIIVERRGEANFFTSAMIKDCIKKVTAVNIHQTLKIDDELEVKAYYAGHVIGAAMFYVKVGLQSCLYTGDYNMTPDRHLGSAQIDKLRVDLMITETTYATTIRDSKRCRESEFLKVVHETVKRGGKVLIPVFALGRAQELCILIETYWERMNLAHVPVYFSAGLVEKANLYYKLFISWTNQKIKETFFRRNMFDFKHIKPFDRSYADKPGPMVLFAAPGMLHAGTSLDVFRKWCGDEHNTCILPGYCVAGTVGNKILSGATHVELDKKTKVEVKLKVQGISFSAHADAKGILQLIEQCRPKNVMLVHGEKEKMQFLKERIEDELGISCYNPANGEVAVINLKPPVPVDLSKTFIKEQPYSLTARQLMKALCEKEETCESVESALKKIRTHDEMEINGILVTDQQTRRQCGKAISGKILSAREVQDIFNLKQHRLYFDMKKKLPQHANIQEYWNAVLSDFEDIAMPEDSKEVRFLTYESVTITYEPAPSNHVRFTWEYKDENAAMKLMNRLDRLAEEKADCQANAAA
ncbi:integrator complex subunit 11-like [Schistocerca gregaria]|uniref:integrator complex subunit 11-like n=1 Tax=Schistocerca gregaria TaxID=7010 RepID=UPI00211EB1F2|nr:integrator complex subunit 11-like [Schistocerca gregaria]